MIDPFAIAVSAFLGISVFTLIWALFRYPVPAEPPVHRRMAQAMGAAGRSTMFEQPLIAPLMSMCAALSRRLYFPALRKRVRRDLEASANPNNYSIEEYLAVCLFSAVVMALLTIGALAILQLFAIWWVPPMFLVGAYIPLASIKSAAEKRVMRISKQLPYTLDLIALMMAAGSTFSEAIATLVRDDPDEDLNRELQIVQAEIDFGTNRAVALQNMGDRIPLDSLRSVVGAINQAEKLGTPLSVILKQQSGMMRMHRSVRAEKLSASASLRILIPSMLILIAVVLVVFGPTIIRFLTGETQMFM